MLLSHIEIENFKSIKELKLDLKPITVLIGPNNSGKSTVLQALALLKQSKNQNVLRLNGDLFNVGQYSDAVLNHDEELAIRIGIGGSIVWNKPLLPITRLVKEIVFFISFTQSGTWIERFQGGLRLDNLLEFGWDDYTRIQPQQQIIREFNGVTLSLNNVRQVGIPILFIQNLLGPFANQRNELEQNLQKLSLVLNQMLNTVVLVPPLRGQDEPSLDLVESLPQDFLDSSGHRTEEMKTIGTLAMKRVLEEKVSKWHQRITGSKVHVAVMPQKKVTAEATRGVLTTNIINEGFGSNQLIYLLIPLASAPRDSTIGLEEPEIHLHPSAQIELVNVLVEEALSENKHLLMTTHSDFLLAYLLTLVASKKLRKEDLAIYSFELKDGITTAASLAIDEHGQVEGGLPSFFKANVDLMKQYSDAILRQS